MTTKVKVKRIDILRELVAQKLEEFYNDPTVDYVKDTIILESNIVGEYIVIIVYTEKEKVKKNDTKK